MSTSMPLNRRDLEDRIVAKAQADEGFKQELLRNPTDTIVKEIGLWVDLGGFPPRPPADPYSRN